MRVLLGSFTQETNSFSVKTAVEEDFIVVHDKDPDGEALCKNNAGRGGFYTALAEAGIEAVPAVFTFSRSSGGPVAKRVVDAFLRELLADFDAEQPLDGVFLELHGATEIEGGTDGCGYILETVRRHVGKDVVVVCSADLHADITDRMAANADGIAGYQTYPHVDMASAGRRAAMHGIMKLRGEEYHQARVRIPMIVPAEGYQTGEGCFAQLVNEAHALVRSGEILDFSIFQMQPWFDLADAGSTVLVTARTEETAAKYAKAFAHRLFDLREEMQIRLYSVDEVIDAAKQNPTDAPVILVDSADSPNSGSSADSSFVLARLLERKETLRACLTVADPAASARAFEIGVGGEGDFTLGGRFEPAFQSAVKVHAYVKSLHDGQYTFYSSQIARQNTGRTAVLQVGSIDIVVYCRMANSSDPQCYRAFGLDPARYRLVVVKSATQYKLPYSKFTRLFYPTDTPGSSTANLRRLPFRRIPRPFYPFDDMQTFDDSVTFL